MDELAKIADQPQPQRVSTYSWGGTPDGIYKQTSKDFCQIGASDPGSIPIFTTYFLHPNLGGCPTTSQIHAYMPRFKTQINAMAKATGRHAAVFLLELDGIGSSSCMAKIGSLPAWEAALRYEMKAMQSLPHTVVYIEGGYSDSNSVRYTAKVLNAIHVQKHPRLLHQRHPQPVDQPRGQLGDEDRRQTTARISSSTPPITAAGRRSTPIPRRRESRTPAIRPGGAWGLRTRPTQDSSSPTRFCGLTRRE